VQSVDGAPNQVATDVLRLKYALVRTTYAVFNTSFTTAMAFFATAISPIMPISTFGIFSAMVHISASASERAC
jgi:predicted RND superfamily exporter protein